MAEPKEKPLVFDIDAITDWFVSEESLRFESDISPGYLENWAFEMSIES